VLSSPSFFLRLQKEPKGAARQLSETDRLSERLDVGICPSISLWPACLCVDHIGCALLAWVGRAVRRREEGRRVEKRVSETGTKQQGQKAVDSCEGGAACNAMGVPDAMNEAFSLFFSSVV